MKRYLRELVLLLAVFGGLPFDVVSDANAAPTNPPLRVTGGITTGSNDTSVYVTAYGAKGDGTTDDTASINSALSAAAASGGTVFFPRGNYHVSTLTMSNATSVSLIGQSAQIVGTNDSTKILVIINCTHCTVDGLDISHLTHAGRGSSTYGVQIYQSNDVVFRNCFIHDTTGAGVWVDQSHRVTVSQNTVKDTLADGIDFVGGSTDGTANGNVIVNSGDDAIAVLGFQSDATQTARVAITGNSVYESHARGITCVGCAESTITGNVIDTTSAAGIYVSQETSVSTRGPVHVAVVGNTVKDANTYPTVSVTQASILVTSGDASHPTTNILVEGNSVSGGAYRCINAGNSLVAGAVSGVSVIGNRCYGPNTAGAGIEYNQVTNGEILSNKSYFAATSGVFVDATSSNISVAENVVYYPNQTDTAGQYGVHNGSVNPFNGINYVTADPSKTALNGSDAATADQGISAAQLTAATAISTTKSSPGIEWQGNAWNTTSLASQPIAFKWQTDPASGNPISGNFSLYRNTNSGGYSQILKINTTGSVTTGGIGFLSTDTYPVGASSQRASQIWGDVFATKLGGAIASATTISPSAAGVTHITGTTTINTINLPVTSFVGTVQFVTDSSLTFTTGGNIANAVTTSAGQIYSATFDGTSWYIK